jgi:hypothetical protein
MQNYHVFMQNFIPVYFFAVSYYITSFSDIQVIVKLTSFLSVDGFVL